MVAGTIPQCKSRKRSRGQRFFRLDVRHAPPSDPSRSAPQAASLSLSGMLSQFAAITEIIPTEIARPPTAAMPHTSQRVPAACDSSWCAIAAACSSVSNPAFFQAASFRSIPTEHLPGEENAILRAAAEEKQRWGLLCDVFCETLAAGLSSKRAFQNPGGGILVDIRGVSRCPGGVCACANSRLYRCRTLLQGIAGGRQL